MVLSLIIPTCNRSRLLDICLRSILITEACDTEYELIVVNDGSTDNTEEIIITLQKKHSNIRHIKIENNTGSPGHARNIGFKAANGNIVAFCDADFVHFCDPIKRTIDYFNKEKTEDHFMVSGEWYLIRHNFDGVMGYNLDTPPSVKNPNQTIPFAAWLAMHRHQFEEIGGFDERFKYCGEDNLFNSCMHRKGLKTYKDFELYAVHMHYKDCEYDRPDTATINQQKQWLKEHKGFKVNIDQEWGKINGQD